MKTIVKNIRYSNNRLDAEIVVNGDVNNVFYEFYEDLKIDSNRFANGLSLIALPAAMKCSEELYIDDVISKTQYNNLLKLQIIYSKWFPHLKRIIINARQILDDLSFTQRKTICCFTGGVDSFCSLIKNEKSIDDLLFVWGFDIPLNHEVFLTK